MKNTRFLAVIACALLFSSSAMAAPSGIVAGSYLAGPGATARTYKDKFSDVVSVKDYGAKAGGIADDSAAIQRAIVALPPGAVLDGGGLTYKIAGVINASGASLRMKNFKFVLGSTYANPGRFNITAMSTELENISVDGGRGTYNVAPEPWRVFGSFAGYSSIRPVPEPMFKVTAYNKAGRVVVRNVHFYNLHADAAIEVTTLGTVFIEGGEYFNLSNKTFHVYHSADDGVTQSGRTVVNNVVARDIGLLPDNFLVDGVAKTFATTTAFPQGSFNFIVSHGDFSITNATVDNYASTGVTSDRNKAFNADNIVIRNSAARAASNNPSGAMWLENTVDAHLSNITIDVKDRDPRDTVLDSSAFQIFSIDGRTNVSNLTILGSAGDAKLRRAIRMSLGGKATVKVDKFYISGNYASNAINSGLMPNQVIGSDIALTSGRIVSGAINIDQPKTFVMDAVKMAGAINVGTSGNAGITGAVDDVVLSRSTFGGFNNNVIVTRSLRIQQNEDTGSISLGNVTGSALVVGNANIAGIAGAGLGASVGIHDNGNIASTTLISAAKSLRFSGNTTSRRVEIGDVQNFSVVGNTIKTDSAEPAVWVNPGNVANVLAGVISNNNVLIKTGTTGGGYVTIKASVAGVTEVNNNKATVAW